MATSFFAWGPDPKSAKSAGGTEAFLYLMDNWGAVS